MQRLTAGLAALASFAFLPGLQSAPAHSQAAPGQEVPGQAVPSPAVAAPTAFPERTVRVVVGFAAGSASDIVYRLVLGKAGEMAGKPNIFVFENMPGAGGNTGLNAIKRADPDGYTIAATGGGPMAVNRYLFKNLPFDPEADFEPIAIASINPIVAAVSMKAPYKTLQELVAYAKANPDKITYSSVGPGSGQHLAGLQFEVLNGVKMRHLPYRITGQLVTDLITGEVPVSFQNIINVLEQARGGQVRLLATASKTRHPSIPDTPTTAEAGMPQFLSHSWFAFAAPKGTPKHIVDRLNAITVAAMKNPEIVKKLQDIGCDPVPMTPAEFKKFIADESVSWRDIITKSGLEPM